MSAFLKLPRGVGADRVEPTRSLLVSGYAPPATAWSALDGMWRDIGARRLCVVEGDVAVPLAMEWSRKRSRPLSIVLRAAADGAPELDFFVERTLRNRPPRGMLALPNADRGLLDLAQSCGVRVRRLAPSADLVRTLVRGPALVR